jgi:signal transduction histidine kinase
MAAMKRTGVESQAMPDRGVLTVETFSCRQEEKDGVEIRIHDTGCGIEKSRLPKIFEPFYTTRDMGTGLGLAVVSRILEGYNGKIDIQSEAGKGTTCAIWLPSGSSPVSGNRNIS